MERKFFICIREQNNVLVEIMYDRTTEKYAVVNLSHGHVCKCRFDTVEDALKDMQNEKDEGTLIDFFPVDFSEIGTK